MTALEQATELQAQAVQILLAEREQIDQRLAQLGYGGAPAKRRGRPPLHQEPRSIESVIEQSS
jgi:hypothetical protein